MTIQDLLSGVLYAFLAAPLIVLVAVSGIALSDWQRERRRIREWKRLRGRE